MAQLGYLDLVEQGDHMVLMPTQKFADTVFDSQQRKAAEMPSQGQYGKL